MNFECPICGYKKNMPMTNGDKIRAMSDEELARLLIFWNDDWGRWETDAGCIDAYDPMDSIEEAIKAEVEWLKQPAEVANES